LTILYIIGLRDNGLWKTFRLFESVFMKFLFLIEHYYVIITATWIPVCFLHRLAHLQNISMVTGCLPGRDSKKMNVKASLHIFPKGGHQIALRNNPGSTNLWTILCEEWLKEMGFL